MSEHGNEKTGIVVIYVFLISGAVMFICFLTKIVIMTPKTGHYEEIQGKVVSFLERQDEDGTLRTPVIEYEVEGKTYLIKCEFESAMKPKIGIPVSIRYNPENPKEAIIASKLFSGDFFLLFFGFGVFIMFLLILSSVSDTKFFKRLELPLIILNSGTLGTFAYLFMGSFAGSFNPFVMIRTTIWAIIPCIFLAFTGLVGFSYIKDIITGTNKTKCIKMQDKSL